MNKTGIGALIVVVVAVVVGFIYISSNNSDSDSSSQTTPMSTQDRSASDVSQTTQEPTNTDTEPISKEEVAKHSSKDDCWTIIDSKVYDITAYIPRHPGGDEILRTCGVDGSSLFNDRTTDNGEVVGSGGSHSSNAKSQLERFYLGDLAE